VHEVAQQRRYAEADSGCNLPTRKSTYQVNSLKFAPDARLRDVILAIRADEARHRDVNQTFPTNWVRRSNHDFSLKSVYPRFKDTTISCV
jgi:hypothetical protein